MPVQLQAEGLQRIHLIDERISVANYHRMVEFMLLLLRQSSE